MPNIFVLMGKSATGKNTIYDILLRNTRYPLKPLVIYTTRPKRVGEVDGVDYYFVTEDTMHLLEEQGLVLEHRCFETVKGTWHYFTVKDHQFNNLNGNFLMLNTVDAYLALKRSFVGHMVHPIYITVPEDVRLMRAIERERLQDNPNYSEVCRRFLSDNVEFTEDKLKLIGSTYQNNIARECAETIINDLIEGRYLSC